MVMYIDHYAIKCLLFFKYGKPMLIRLVLLLHEFYLEIRDKKCVEKQMAYHLSRLLDNIQCQDNLLTKDKFLDEQVFEIPSVMTHW